jgi:hypothetical protein
MLSAARSALEACRVLAPGAQLPPFHARMSGNMVVQCWTGPGTRWIVKVEVIGGLAREHAGLEAGHRALPRSVPRPVHFATHLGSPVLVSCGLEHEPLQTQRTDHVEILLRGLDEFLTAAATSFRVEPAGDRFASLHAQVRAAAMRADRSDADALAQRCASAFAAHEPILQHGDFVRNNLGVARDALAIFDWEDFGRVDVPGFDIVTLALSIVDFDVARFAASALVRSIVSLGAARLGLSTAEFVALVPGYLGLFVHAKATGGYGPEVAERALAAIGAWDRTGGTR